MPETQLSLSWEAYQKNICSGLSLLQQRGEFVDMTLAADGHLVKVHQMVLSLVSPYLKELISSVQCPQPVIFLNNISYTTLCSILEYIYTGEVMVSKDRLPDLIAAGRALHIKGLNELDDIATPQNNIRNSFDDTLTSMDGGSFSTLPDTEELSMNSLVGKLHEHKENKKSSRIIQNILTETSPAEPVHRELFENDQHTTIDIHEEDYTEMSNEEQDDKSNSEFVISNDKTKGLLRKSLKNLQYSISNQGGLQIIVNRYIYTLKYVTKKKLLRSWRCADHATKKCRAIVYTNYKNEVVKRTYSHNHPLHDDKILKKVRFGNIFTAYNEAESMAEDKKCEKNDAKSRLLPLTKNRTLE